MKLEENSNTNLDGPKGQKAKISVLSILAFTLSIISIASIFLYDFPYIEISEIIVVPLIAISAIVMGGIALVAIGRSEGKLRGKPMAGIGVVLAMLLLLICLCIPLLNRTSGPHPPGLIVKNQLLSIEVALELFRSDSDYYPPSGPTDDEGRHYCGAMKLCEAMMGRDLMGFHPDSVFRSDGTDGKGTMLYPDANNLSKGAYMDNLSKRKGPYLPVENGNPYRPKDLYENVGPFDGNEYVLCDELRRVTHIGTGRRVGMPVLYYKANTSKTAHDINDPNNPENIYDYKDNHALLALGVPGDPTRKHPLFENPKIFYEMIRNYRLAKTNKPQRADTFILLSAGLDGLYGTKDDIANFDMRWKPK